MSSIRPMCNTCNKNRCAVNYKRDDVTHYRKKCDDCSKVKQRQKPKICNWEKSGYRKKATCDLCGFRSLYPTQMTVFHIDGNMNNIALNNLRSICLNCVEVVKKKAITWKRGDLIPDN